MLLYDCIIIYVRYYIYVVVCMSMYILLYIYLYLGEVDKCKRGAVQFNIDIYDIILLCMYI